MKTAATRFDDETERIKDKLIAKFDKSLLGKYSSDEEIDTEREKQWHLEKGKDISMKSQDISNDVSLTRHHLRDGSKNESFSMVETDASVLAIQKKIDDMRKNNKSKSITFRNDAK